MLAFLGCRGATYLDMGSPWAAGESPPVPGAPLAPPSSQSSVSAGLFLVHFSLTPFSCSCWEICYSLDVFSQRYHQHCCWAQFWLGPFWSWLCPLFGPLLASCPRGDPCKTTSYYQTVPHKPEVLIHSLQFCDWEQGGESLNHALIYSVFMLDYI